MAACARPTLESLEVFGAMASEVTEAQLSSIFQFKGEPFPEQQSIEAVAGFVRLLSNHCSNMKVINLTHSINDQ